MAFLQGLKLASALLAFATPSLAVGIAPGQIKNFVTFGDSYTDSSYYPAADGGYAWPTWAAGYGPFNLYGEQYFFNAFSGPMTELGEKALPDQARLAPTI